MLEQIWFLRCDTVDCYNHIIFVDQVVMATEEQTLQREAREGMTADEAEFSIERAFDSQVYQWIYRYRPHIP
jgi:hypothetical protein